MLNGLLQVVERRLTGSNGAEELTGLVLAVQRGKIVVGK